MNSPHLISYIYSSILIIAGLFSFFSNPEKPLTALIPPVVGLILAALTPLMKNGNKTVSHIIVGITLLFSVQTAYMAISSGKVEDETKRNRRLTVFSLMSIAGFGATGYYIARFINIKKSQIK